MSGIAQTGSVEAPQGIPATLPNQTAHKKVNYLGIFSKVAEGTAFGSATTAAVVAVALAILSIFTLPTAIIPVLAFTAAMLAAGAVMMMIVARILKLPCWEKKQIAVQNTQNNPESLQLTSTSQAVSGSFNKPEDIVRKAVNGADTRELAEKSIQHEKLKAQKEKYEKRIGQLKNQQAETEKQKAEEARKAGEQVQQLREELTVTEKARLDAMRELGSLTLRMESIAVVAQGGDKSLQTLAEREKQIGDLQKQLDDTVQSKKAIETQSDDLKAKIASLEQEDAAKQKKIKELEDQVSDMKNQSQDTDMKLLMDELELVKKTKRIRSWKS